VREQRVKRDGVTTTQGHQLLVGFVERGGSSRRRIVVAVGLQHTSTVGARCVDGGPAPDGLKRFSGQLWPLLGRRPMAAFGSSSKREIPTQHPCGLEIAARPAAARLKESSSLA
jgi:hypothetical protein